MRLLLTLLTFVCLSFAAHAANTISLLAIDTGVIGQTTPNGSFQIYAMTAYGTYTGTAPTSATAQWTNCGTGTPTVYGIGTGIYSNATFPGTDGTFVIEVSTPPTAGAACTLTITTNLSTVSSINTFVAPNVSGTPVTAQIHNAPGWLPSTVYTPASGPKTRVNNGPGWTPGTTTWNPGSLLRAYELTSGGSCTSASSGGPTGTGSSIPDGSCTWKYLSDTDYISLTGWNRDGPQWQSGTTYTFGNVITTYVGGILRSYFLTSSDGDTGGGNPWAFCTSTAAPSGTGTHGANSIGPGWLVTSDGCTWTYMGDILYSSQVASIPFITYSPTALPGPSFGGQSIAHLTNNFTASVWNDREYLAGSNGELSPIISLGHQGIGFCCGDEWNYQACIGPSYWFDCATITVTPAAGEGFKSGFTPSTPLTGYDVSKGVGLRNPSSTTTAGGSFGPVGLWARDTNLRINGLQIKSATNDGIVSFNDEIFTDLIVDGGYPAVGNSAAVWVDVPVIVANSLILSHGWNGLAFKFGSGVSLFNTIVNLGSVSGAVGITYQWAWVWTNLIAANNAIYGFPHAGAYSTFQPPQVFDASSKNNVTDTPGPDSGTGVPISGIGTGSGTVIVIPNSTYSATGSAMFVSPGSDWRPGSALIGAGASYGTFSWGCASGTTGCINLTVNEDTPDFLGTARPQSGSWTVGAEQSVVAAPPCCARLRWLGMRP